MPTTLEKFTATYGKQEQPTSAATSTSALAGVVAAPPLSQVERLAANYSRGPSVPQPRSTANVSAATAEQQRAVRDRLWPQISSTQKMAACYGTSSRTIPQANFQLAEYRRKTDEAGVDRVVATRVLDAVLAEADAPGGIRADMKIAEVRERARAIGIDPDDAQRCVAAFLTLGDEPGK